MVSGMQVLQKIMPIVASKENTAYVLYVFSLLNTFTVALTRKGLHTNQHTIPQMQLNRYKQLHMQYASEVEGI